MARNFAEMIAPAVCATIAAAVADTITTIT
jgi:hypothetical protein